MLATESSLNLLKHNYQVFGDWTFRCCPKYFGQLYTLHVFKDGFYITSVHFILSSQSENNLSKCSYCFRNVMDWNLNTNKEP